LAICIEPVFVTTLLHILVALTTASTLYAAVKLTCIAVQML